MEWKRRMNGERKKSTKVEKKFSQRAARFAIWFAKLFAVLQIKRCARQATRTSILIFPACCSVCTHGERPQASLVLLITTVSVFFICLGLASEKGMARLQKSMCLKSCYPSNISQLPVWAQLKIALVSLVQSP